MELLLLLVKNSLSSQEIATEWIWYRWTKELKILLATWMESEMMTILLMFRRWVAWLMPHLIVNNSALVDMIFTIWWIVLTTGLL